MTRCPLCDAAAPPPFLRRPSVPVHQNLPAATAAEARAAPRGALEMVACEACGFVFNRAFDPTLPRYGPGYDNAQSHSPSFAAHLDALARRLVEERGVRGARIVEIGCGRGDFLRRLVAWPGAGNLGVGFDPAYDGPGTDLGGRLQFVRGLYGRECADTPADIVVCRHVIEHVADPLALLHAVRAALRHAPGARVFFETPDVGWILRNAVLWDFFYEHCSLFSAGSLAGAFARAGFADMQVGHVFCGQYLWLEARAGQRGDEARRGLCPRPAKGRGPLETGTSRRQQVDCKALTSTDAIEIVALAARYATTETARLAAWRDRLASLAADGRVALWGAGAKGVTLACLADPDGQAVDCVVDINPAKHGRFVTGTGHPIVAPATLAARGVRHVVLMNPAYRAEIAVLLPACGGARLAEWDDRPPPATLAAGA